MFHGPGGPRWLLQQETRKAGNVGVTLTRLGSYFKPYSCNV